MIMDDMRYVFYALILIVGSTALVLGHIYVYRRLVRDVKFSPVVRRVGMGLLIGLASLIPLGFILPRLVSRACLGPLMFLTFFWLGFLFYLVLLLGCSDLGRLAAKLVRRLRRRAKPEVDLQRRAFLARVVASSALMGTGAVTGLGVGSAFGDFRTPEVPVRLERLPRALSGFRIALLSDLHMGPVLGRRFLDAVVEKTNALKPDLVAITGDVVDMPVDLLGAEVEALRNLRSRYGTWFSTGNHEFIYGAGPWMDFFRSLGIHVLDNRRLPVGDPGPGGASFDLAGIHDYRAAVFASRYKPDLQAALAGRDPDRELVLLAHQPVQVYSAAESGVGLQLSGHTHGGQLFPFTFFTWLSQPYISGLHRHGRHTQIYVTRGTGFWGPPMRVLAAPEITCIVLVA
jgi:predicted MPP superfamily phosphohydrolase